MFQCAHIQRQLAVFFHLTCEVILHFVLICGYVEKLRARVKITHAVLTEANVAIVSQRA